LPRLTSAAIGTTRSERGVRRVGSNHHRETRKGNGHCQGSNNQGMPPNPGGKPRGEQGRHQESHPGRRERQPGSLPFTRVVLVLVAQTTQA